MDYNQAKAILETGVKDFNCLYEAANSVVCEIREKQLFSKSLHSNMDVINYLRVKLQSKQEERFIALYFKDDKLIKSSLLAIGTINKAHVYPRSIIKGAIECGSNKIILSHNHPSGSLKPSDSDLAITKTIIKAAKVMDIIISDHIIIGGGGTGYTSFKEDNYMPTDVSF